MTIQCNDTCFHDRIEYQILDHSGSNFFEANRVAKSFGIRSTDCYRGYEAHFSILDGALFLTRIHTGGSIQLLSGEYVKVKVNEGPVLFGTVPREGNDYSYAYKNFRYPIPFTGGLILGESGIWPLALTMQLGRLWFGNPLREISFVNGSVTAENDLTSAWESIEDKITEAMRETPWEEKEPVDEQVKEWMRAALSHKYRW